MDAVTGEERQGADKTFSQSLMSRARLFDGKGNLIGDADSIAFESDNFLWMVGENADIPQSQVNQDLRANAAFVLDHALTGWLAI